MSEAVALLVLCALLASCGSTPTSLTGVLTFKRLGPPELCSLPIGIGRLESGSGEILGTIEMAGVASQKVNTLSDSICSVNLSATELNLDTDVLVVVFETIEIQARWILKRSDFTDGVIELSAF